MGYWKCSCDLYFHPVMKEITKPLHARDGFMVARESIFFKLLSYCANGHAFEGVEQFAKYAMLPARQCQAVWDVCVKSDVLRKTEDGYTATDWMSESGLLPNAQNARLDASPRKADNYTSSAQSPQNGAILARESANTARFPVRPNVYLSEAELAELHERFPSGQVTMMLDKLSAFKTERNWRYRSDMDAIRRWVVKWLGQELAKRETNRDSVQKFYEASIQNIDGIPTWLNGKG